MANELIPHILHKTCHSHLAMPGHFLVDHGMMKWLVITGRGEGYGRHARHIRNENTCWEAMDRPTNKQHQRNEQTTKKHCKEIERSSDDFGSTDLHEPPTQSEWNSRWGQRHSPVGRFLSSIFPIPILPIFLILSSLLLRLLFCFHSFFFSFSNYRTEGEERKKKPIRLE